MTVRVPLSVAAGAVTVDEDGMTALEEVLRILDPRQRALALARLARGAQEAETSRALVGRALLVCDDITSISAARRSWGRSSP